MTAVRRLLRGERGNTAVEFAIVLPALLLFLMLIMETGRLFNAWLVITNETREAARYAIAGTRDGDSNTQFQNEVFDYEQGRVGQVLNPGPLQVTVTTQRSGQVLTAVTVSSSYTMALMTPLAQAIVPSVTLTANAVMRDE